MRLGEYGRIERDITAHANGNIYHRWKYGRRLLCDTEITTPNENFRHGAMAKLIRASGGKLSERELQRRIQCGRAYPKRSQIRRALDTFESWADLYNAGFPPYEGEEDELPYNPLATDELIIQHETGTGRINEDGQYEGGGIVPREDCEEGALIPRNTYSDSTPMYEIDRFANDELEIASRFSAKARKLRRYADSLIKAVNGDLNVSLGEAERRLHGGDE